MNSRKTLTSILIYLAVVFVIFSFSFWRLRMLAEGVPVGDAAEIEYKERDPNVPAKPFFSLAANRTYGTNERPRLWLNYRDIDSIDFRVYRVGDPVKFFRGLDDPHRFGQDEEGEFKSYYRKRKPTFLERVHAFKSYFYNGFRDYFRAQLKNSSRRRFNQTFRAPDELKEAEVQRTPLNVADYARVPLLNDDQLVRGWREKLPPLDNEYDRRSIPLGQREPGVYLVEAVNGDLRAFSVAIVTDLTMIEKTSRDGQLMVYAVNRQTGAPRAGVQVQIVEGQNTLTTGTTDNQGILRTKVARKAAATGGGEDAGEGDGGEGESEGVDGEGESEDDSPSYLVMATERENFAISDLDAYIFGGYGGESESLTSYVYTDRPVYRPNQKVYFKGILRRLVERGYQTPSGAVTVSVEDTSGGKLFERELTLSSRGTFNGELDIPEDAPLGTYNINAQTAEGGTASGYFDVQEYKKPEFKVAVAAPQRFAPTGSEVRFNVSARYFFGSPVARADVKYYVYRSRYYHDFADPEGDPVDDFGVQAEDETGGYEEGGDYADSMVKEGEGKLDAQGNFQINFTVPQPSAKERWDYTYRLEAQVTDASRRMMQSSAQFVGTRGNTVADASTDRYVYYQGDTAKILVRTRDYEGREIAANVTLTFVENTWEKIEKNDYGYKYFEYKLNERELSTANVQTNARGEATFDYRVERPGNIQIKTTIQENGKPVTSMGGSLWVADREQRFADYSYQESETVKLIPDKKSYKAGETAHVLALLPTDKAHLLVTTELLSVMTVRQISATGRAVVIDVPIEARHAPNFFLDVSYVKNSEMYSASASLVVPPRDRLLKVEIVPNKREFKPRETASYTISARNADGSPAAGAEVSFGVVDEAIYSIMQETVGDIRKQFYAQRYNEVNTTFAVNYHFTGYAGKKAIQLAANKRAQQLADLKNEGDFVQPLIRKIFKDTAYWQPSIVTGADGKANVKVELPDNLTTWRATARAVTADTRVGSATTKIVERKDVIVRLATPRFLTSGDTVTLSGIAHNYLNADKTTQISLGVTGARLLDPPAQTVTIPKNGEHRINWRVSAPQTGDLTLLVKALTDTDSDAVELRIPIVPRGLKQTTGEAATLSGDNDAERTVTINLPPNADPRARTLRIEAAPSVASTLFGALDYLTGFPYGCVEQTMSQFLPTVVVANTLRDVEQASIRDTNDINRKVKKGLTRLYNFQHDDGGWGWWKDDPTDPWMTAYVVDGLTMASRAGYQTDDARVERGRGKLSGLLDAGRNDDGAEINIETRAYMVYALNASGGVNPRYVEDLFTNRGRLQPYARALLALTLKGRGDARARQVASEIERSAAQSDFDAHWQSRRKIGSYEEDISIEATALSIKALAQIAPESGILPKAVRWTVASRRRGDRYWVSTRQTAFVIFGLTDYLKVSKELSPDYALEVYINNEQVAAGQVTAADAARAKSFVVTRKNEQVGGSTQVRFVKRGAGVLYATAALEYATNDEQTAPQSTGGLKITREYLRLRVDDDGGGNLKWKTEPLAGELRSGDQIVSRLVIEGTPAPYLLIEDPIPAGAEQVENVGGLDLNYTDGKWTDWYSAREFRDQRTAFFLNFFDGRAVFQYALRVQEPGDFRIAPARVELMYQPAVQSNTASGKLTILDRQ
ncbi:MAG TPA: MG2 domain-containing protein [Pyrinomonadaceae bacterium]|nr:MG2 domain-containing protein [Pyrinomonadaceae bacterium]